MRSQTVEPVELIYILRFFNDVQLERYTKGVDEGDVMWLFHLFKKTPVAEALNTCIRLKPKNKRRQTEGALTTYCEANRYLLPA